MYFEKNAQKHAKGYVKIRIDLLSLVCILHALKSYRDLQVGYTLTMEIKLI